MLSLDAFRGLTIALMLLVNNVGRRQDTPPQLMHAGYHGLHLADFVFPWFLLCVGMAIPFSAASFQRKGLPEWRYELKILQRAAILFGLGVLLHSASEGQLVIEIGVLQLIAFSYIAGALLYDLPTHRRAIIAGLLLIGYGALIKFLPIPGVGKGHVREGVNAISYLNFVYLRRVGLEGLPLAIPTSCIVLFGTALGDLARQARFAVHSRALLLAAWGFVLVGVGELWAMRIPAIKPIWTPSYVLITAGTGTIFLSVLYALIDLRAWNAWALPLVVFGSNAILAYVAPILVKDLVLRAAHLYTSGLFRSIVYMALWWAVLYVLYRKRVFLRV